MSELEDFETSLHEEDGEQYVLRLYITGMTPNSKRAVENIKKICNEHLTGRYELEIIDIYQQPSLAASEQIIAAPTLVKLFPSPLKKIIGDLSNTDKVLQSLNVRPKM
jgi:circadian clock protein KaiB